jgi:hypothetical protein
MGRLSPLFLCVGATLLRHSDRILPKEVILSPEQYGRAEAEAIRRQTVNEAKRLRGRNNAPASGKKALDIHRLGCVGEIALAALLGLEDQVFCEEAAVSGSADLPGGIDVKTRPKHGYDLLVPLQCRLDHRYVLVTYEETILVVGWILGEDAAKHRYIKELKRGRPCYVVPQADLRPIETLEELCG